MAEPHSPAGINSAMLTSMQQHQNASSSLAVGAGSQGLGGTVGGKMMLDDAVKSSNITLGEVSGHVDQIFSSMGGALSANPMEQAFAQNTSPFGISHPGFDMAFAGNMELKGVTLTSQVNAPAGLPGITGAQGQQH